MNYSLLVMKSAGMMKMAAGEGSPLRQGAGTGPRWFLVDTEACGGGTPDLGYVMEVWGYIRGVGVENKARESTRGPQGQGHPPPYWLPQDSSCVPFRSSIFYIFQK